MKLIKRATPATQGYERNRSAQHNRAAAAASRLVRRLTIPMTILMLLSMITVFSRAAEPVVLYMTQTMSDSYLLLSLHVENAGEVEHGILGMKLSIRYNGRYFRPIMDGGKIFMESPDALINPSSGINVNASNADSIIIVTPGSASDIITTDGLLGVIKFELTDQENMPYGTFSFDFSRATGDNQIVDGQYQTIRDMLLFGTVYINQEQAAESSGDEENPQQPEAPQSIIGAPPVYVGGGRFQYANGAQAEIEMPKTSASTEEPSEELGIMKLITLKVGSLYMSVDDEIVEMEAAPYIKNDRCLLPIRYLAEALDYHVDWKESTREVTIKKGDTSIVLTIDRPIAYVNGQQYELDCAPEIVESRTFVPIRFVTTQLSGRVSWNSDSQTVAVESY